MMTDKVKETNEAAQRTGTEAHKRAIQQWDKYGTNALLFIGIIVSGIWFFMDTLPQMLSGATPFEFSFAHALVGLVILLIVGYIILGGNSKKGGDK